MRINGKRLEKAIYASVGLIIAYVGNLWLSNISSWPELKYVGYFIAFIFLTIAFYQIIPN